MIPINRTLLACALGALLAIPASAVFAQYVPQDQSDPQQQTTDQDATTGSMQSDSNDWQQAGTPPQPTTPPVTDEDRASDVDAMQSDDDFARLDRDQDGRISSAEAGADGEFNARFATLDSDGDGYVSQAEFDAGTQAQTPTPTP